jgi:hypothetical protein
MPQCMKCFKQFNIWCKINKKWRNLGNRKYCIKCSPYKGHNTKKIHLIIDSISKTCPRCKETKSLNDFYVQNIKGRLKHSYCKKCCGELTLSRQIKLKKQAVEYKGGCCLLCGYNKYYGALDFHHLDPKNKKIQISNVKKLKFESIKKELDKCVCICKNCHAEVHAGISKI